MNQLGLAVFVLGMMVVVVSCVEKSFEENLKILKTIDIDTVLTNDRIMKNYIDCVIGAKKCTKEGTALKASWKDGLDKGCDECSEDEKRKVKKIVKHIYVNRNDWYKLLVESLDKDKKYRDKYEKYIQEILEDKTI